MEIGDKVRVHAVGYLKDGLKFLDTRKAGAPLEFTIGSHTVFPVLERSVMDMAPDSKKTICIAASDAYGDYDEALIERIPKQDFAQWETLPVGQFVEFQGQSGPIRCKVLEPEGEFVVLDHNHELAGKDLFYDIELLGMADESAVEHEKHAQGCACGCDRLRESLAG